MAKLSSKGRQNNAAVFVILIALVICSFLITYIVLKDYTSTSTTSASTTYDDSGYTMGSVSKDANADPYLNEDVYVAQYLADRQARIADDDNSISEGLVAYFSFNEGSDSKEFSDSKGNNAWCSGSECPESGVSGHEGKAILFDGVNDLVRIPYVNDYSFNSFSVSFWFKGTQDNADQFFAGNWDGSPNSLGWQSDIASGGLCDGIDGYVSEDGSAGSDQHRVYRRECGKNYMDGNWHHYAFVFKPRQEVSLYVDGSLVGQVVGNLSAIDGVNTAQKDIRLGSGFRGAPNGANLIEMHFKGYMDEFRLYNRALNSQEIRDL